MSVFLPVWRNKGVHTSQYSQANQMRLVAVARITYLYVLSAQVSRHRSSRHVAAQCTYSYERPEGSSVDNTYVLHVWYA